MPAISAVPAPFARCLAVLLAFAPTAHATTLPPDSLEQALVNAEDHRRADDPAFAEAAQHRSAAIRAQAATALGRIGSRRSVGLVAPLLRDRVASVREQAAFALGLIGGEEALQALRAQARTQAPAAVRAEIYRALGRAGDASDLAALTAGLAGDDTSAAGAAQGLGFLFLRHDATLPVPAATHDGLLALVSRRGEVGVHAAFGLARTKVALTADQAARAAAEALVAPESGARGYLLRVAARTGATSALITALKDDADPGVRVDAARALGGVAANDAVLVALTGALAARDAQLVVQALQSLARLGAAAAPTADAVAALAHGAAPAPTAAPTADAPAALAHAAPARSPWIHGSAIETLVAIAPDRALAPVDAALATRSTSPVVLGAALRALAAFGDEASLQRALPYLASPTLAISTAAADAVALFSDELLAAHARAPLLAAVARHDLALTSAAAGVAARLGWREFAAPLAAAYDAFTRADDVEAKIAVLDALAKLGDDSHLPLLERALDDDERLVALAAAAAYQALTGVDVSARVPDASRVRGLTPSVAELRRAARSRVVIETSKGEFVLQMLDAAPLVAHNFVTLARAGFYDGLTFHRVVPRFVVQGGDPRGDGYGGPGYVIRDQVSTVSHDRGTVGMASAGKDTAGSQLFVNHGPNLHLDGNYTVFARVVRGMDVVDRLEVGDTILRATVRGR